MLQNQIQKGKLLLSDTTILSDATFNRTVILVSDYSDDGAVGFILNKPIAATLNELISDINADFTVYNGGPVEQTNLYFVHTIPDLIPDSIEIADGLFWGGNFEITKTLINQNQIKKHNIRFFLGYCGWSFNQLEQEIEKKSWVLIDNNEKTGLFKINSATFWRTKIVDLGGDYPLWSNAPENPILN